MKLKNFGYIAFWGAIAIGGIKLLSPNVKKEREAIAVSVYEIIEKKEQLDSMYDEGICEISNFKKNNRDGVVTILSYKCNKDLDGKNIEKDYLITLSDIDKEYIGRNSERCKDRRINYGSLGDDTPILSSIQSVIEKKGESLVIDNVDCKKVLKVIEA